MGRVLVAGWAQKCWEKQSLSVFIKTRDISGCVQLGRLPRVGVCVSCFRKPAKSKAALLDEHRRAINVNK